MGFIRNSVAVVLVAVLVNSIVGWFRKDVKVPPVVGFVAPGWEHVRDVYRQLYADDDDRGSSLGVYHKGKLVVDLRGGFADEKELWPWQENTVTRLFSTTKGIGAICIGVLADRGYIEYDALVTKYWPEFGVNGKENITVEMLLSHQSGLAFITSDSYNLWDEVNDFDKLTKLLAEQEPIWEIGTAVGYHALTMGLYIDQLVWRVDPNHRSLTQFFTQEIAEPFGIDLQFGLPDREMYRMASMENQAFKLKYLLLPYVRDFLKVLIFGQDNPKACFQTIIDQLTDPEIGLIMLLKRPDVNKLWNPSVYGYANGHSLARLYGILGNGGSHDEKILMSEKAVESQTKILKSGRDYVTTYNVSYGRGYNIFMSPKNTPMFGTPGFGGQMGYADPAYKLGIGFTTNYISSMGLVDLRYRTLERAIYECLDKI